MNLIAINVIIIAIILSTVSESYSSVVKIHHNSANANSNIKCEEFCDEDGGICIEDICTCRTAYTTIPRDRFKYCNYEMKRKLVSAFMELIIGFGAGHFYCERTVNGFIKLVMISLSCCFALCLIVAGNKVDIDSNDATHAMLRSVLPMTCSCFCLLFLWQITDFILFLCGFYSDGNGVMLY